jgi:hypothetical protein
VCKNQQSIFLSLVLNISYTYVLLVNIPIFSKSISYFTFGVSACVNVSNNLRSYYERRRGKGK